MTITKQTGSTLLELAVAGSIIGILVAVFLSQVLRYQEVAEKTVMETTVINMRTGLKWRMAELMLQDRMRDLSSVAQENPIDWLAAPPAVSAPRPAAAAPAAPYTVAKQVRELSPQQRAESEYRKALALVQQGRVNEAIDSLNQAVQLDTQHSAARQTLIGLLVEARRFSEAERRLQEGLGLDRAQPELAMTLARLQVERGDLDAAIETLERTQSAAADRADYHGFMAALLQREGRHREAIEHYRQALRRASSAVWQMGLGISLQAENRFQEARDAFNRAKAANTLSPELQAFVEQRLKQLGQ